MENKDKKVTIKLERHLWPDEIKRVRKKRRSVALVIGTVVVSFILGMLVSPKTGVPFITGPSELSRFESVYNELRNNWYFGKEMEDVDNDLITNAIVGMLEKNGDIHTSYMTAEEAKEFSSSIDQEFVGIGVQYTGNGLNLVTRVYKNSPAEKAGMQAGDIFSAVDGISIDGLDSDQIKELIVGEAGTEVSITVKRKNEEKTFDIVREAVSAIAYGEVLQPGVGYLEISSFGRNLADAVEVYLDDFIRQDAKHLIIDLRDNGGGYLQAINELSKFFFENGDVVYTEEFLKGKDSLYTVSSSKKEKYPFEEIVILQNEGSASASEVFALAMRENKGSTILGVNSYGKGSVQTQTQFSDGSVLKITIAKWNSPHGNNIDQVGIAPDVEVKLHDIFYLPFIEMEASAIVRFDSVDASVAYMQTAMNYLGLHHGRTDGYFDNSTLQSLRRFKKEYNLSMTDYIDQETMTSAYSAVISKWAYERQTDDVQLNKAIEVVLGE